MTGEKLIGVRIAQIRESRGISRTQLADEMAVSAQAVGKWERGESLPDVITLRKMSELLGVNMDSFFVVAENDGFSGDDVLAGAAVIHSSLDRVGFGAANGGCNGFRAGVAGAVLDWFSDDGVAERNLSMSNWKDADFTGLKNVAEKFSCANVINCNFSGAGLSGIIFKSNNIKGCNFSGADLSEAKFSSCNVQKNDFNGGNFQKVLFGSCGMQGNNFTAARFVSAKMKYVSFNRNIVTDAIFIGTTFLHSALANMEINSDVSDCAFSSCGFKNITFKDMTFKNTFFKNHKSRNVTFINCKADKISYSFLEHSKTNLDGIERIEG